MLSAYDVVEKGGFVWLFNGSCHMPMDARPPIPYVPELDDPKCAPCPLILFLHPYIACCPLAHSGPF